MVIALIMIGGQVMIIFVGGEAFHVERLNGAQWGYSILLGAISLPIGVIIRLVPDELVSKILPRHIHRKKTPQLVVSDEDRRYEWNEGLVGIREELAFYKTLRGGRLRQLKFKLTHPREILLPFGRSRSGSRSRSSSILQTPNTESFGGQADFLHNHTSEKDRRNGRSRANSAFGPAAAMAGVVAGSIAGWSPIDRTHGERDSFGGDRKNDLEAGQYGGDKNDLGVTDSHTRQPSADATATTSSTKI